MLAANLQKIKSEIASAAKVSGRTAEAVRLVAVTKTWPAAIVQEAARLGIVDFAENYVQEALEKIEAVRDQGLHWHFIGHLQTNKVKSISGKFDLIHSVDSGRVASEISKRSDKAQDILLQINLVGEASKSGVRPDAAGLLIEEIQNLQNLRLRGLMFMPPLDDNIGRKREYYRAARELRDKLARGISAPHSLDELSMGTSHDFVPAIAEGATMVRLGTVLFGERK